MNLCLATYSNRLAALLENAAELHFFQVRGHAATPKGYSPMPGGGPSNLLLTLHCFGIDTLVCGGVSPHYLDALHGGGIKVHAWLGGETPEVLRAFTEGGLDALRLPGAPKAAMHRPQPAKPGHPSPHAAHPKAAPDE